MEMVRNDNSKNNIIRSKLSEALKEYDALYDSEEEWNESKESMKDNFEEMLDMIENDRYEEARERLSEIMNALTDWDNAMNKYVGNE